MSGKRTIAEMVKRHIAEWEIILDDSKKQMEQIQRDLAKISVRLYKVRRNLPEIPPDTADEVYKN